MLDWVYRRTEGEPAFQAARPTRAELEGLLDKNIVRFMKMLRRFHLLDVGDCIDQRSHMLDRGP